MQALVRSGEQPQSPACLPRESLCSVHEMAPSTGEELPLASAGCGIDENGGKVNMIHKSITSTLFKYDGSTSMLSNP